MINLAVNSRVSDDKLKTIIHWGNNVPSTFSGMGEVITSFVSQKKVIAYRRYQTPASKQNYFK